jgi:hypothetical protein
MFSAYFPNGHFAENAIMAKFHQFPPARRWWWIISVFNHRLQSQTDSDIVQTMGPWHFGECGEYLHVQGSIFTWNRVNNFPVRGFNFIILAIWHLFLGRETYRSKVFKIAYKVICSLTEIKNRLTLKGCRSLVAVPIQIFDSSGGETDGRCDGHHGLEP